jgi:hypothetical protein
MRAVLLCLLVVAGPAEAAKPTRAKVAQAVADAPSHRLRKSELRPTLKKIMPRVRACYERELETTPGVDGVVNIKLTVRNAPTLGLTLSVSGFETSGALGTSKSFLACVTRTLEGKVYAAIPTLGSADFIYPFTFTTVAPSDRDRAVVDRADASAQAEDWAAVLTTVASGLELTSLDGPLRRHLIELGGLAACHASDAPTAQHYYALASPEYEAEIETACAASSIPLP